jgi:hypothetical protein
MATAPTQDMVAAVFRDHADGQAVYNWLTSQGYASPEINVLMSEGTKAAYYSHEEDERVEASSYAAEGMATGGAIGTAVGAAAAAFAAIGTSLVVPGLGLVVAGPIAAALAGAGAGAVTGGVVGGLVGLGIPESNAKAYDETLRQGGMAIGVVPHSSQDASRIKTAFKNFGGENVITI